MNRGNITVKPQSAVSYSNPDRPAPPIIPPSPPTQTVALNAYTLGLLTTVTVLPQ